MRLKVIACKVLYREISALSASCKNTIDVTYLRQGLHDTPDLLRKTLQEEIDAIETGSDLKSGQTRGVGEFDALLLGYGLCSNAICGIKSNKYKMVIPKAHDCITLFLGSKEAYREYFDKNSGTYWYTPGWIEHSSMPGEDRINLLYEEYLEKYGEDNAQYLIDMNSVWLKEYSECGFIDWEEFDNQRFIEYTKDCAKYLNWKYTYYKGSNQLLKDFLDGRWDSERFTVIEPGMSFKPSHDENVIGND